MISLRVVACVLATMLLAAALEGGKSDWVEKAKKAKDQARQCLKDAGGDADARRACREALGGDSGGAPDAADDVTDSRKHKVFDELTQDAVYEAMMGCAADATKETCFEAMKEAKVNTSVSGISKSEIKDFGLCRDVHAALGRKLRDIEVGEAEDCAQKFQTEFEAIVPAIMRNGVKLCASRDTSDPAVFAEHKCKEAGEETAAEVCKDCEGAECDSHIEEAISKFHDKKPEDVTFEEIESFKKRATDKRFKEWAEGCGSAKEEKVDATCEDASAVSHCGKGPRPGGDTLRGRTEVVQAKSRAATQLVKGAVEPCLEKESPEEKETCFEDAKEEAKVALKQLVGGEGMEEDKVDKRVTEIWESGVKLFLMEKERECKKGASDETANAVCDGGTGELLQAAKINEAVDLVRTRGRMNAVQESRSSCTEGADVCRQKAKDEHKAAGGEPARFHMESKLAALDAAILQMVACEDAEEAAAEEAAAEGESSTETCEEQAAMAYINETGREDVDIPTTAAIRRLASAARRGVKIVLQKRKWLDVSLETDANECVMSITEKVKEHCEKAASDSGTEASAVQLSCDMVSRIALYAAKLVPSGLTEKTDEELEQLAKDVADHIGEQGTDLGDGSERRLEGRRLVEVVEVFAAQDTSLCAEDDDACQSEDLTLSGAPSPSPSPSESDLAAPRYLAWVVAGVSLAQLAVLV